MAKIGRPRALDEVKRREVCALIAAGYGIEGAARYIGCSPSTIRREAMRNEEFREHLRRSELGAQLDPLRAMRAASSTHWRAAAWLLERTQPNRFGRQDAKAFKPDVIESFFAELLEMVAEEIEDPQLRVRVYRRLLTAMNGKMRDLQLAEKPIRNPVRVQEMLKNNAA